jgi:hypothetical protein
MVGLAQHRKTLGRMPAIYIAIADLGPRGGVYD